MFARLIQLFVHRVELGFRWCDSLLMIRDAAFLGNSKGFSRTLRNQGFSEYCFFEFCFLCVCVKIMTLVRFTTQYLSDKASFEKF